MRLQSGFHYIVVDYLASYLLLLLPPPLCWEGNYKPVNRKTITTTLLKNLLYIGFLSLFFLSSSCKAVAVHILGSSSTVLPACQAVPSVIVFSSLLWVLGFRQTKTCQAKWTLIAFKPKLSFFCRSPTTTRYTNGFHLALVTCNTRPLKQLLGRL